MKTTPTLLALMMLLAFSCGSPCKEDGTSNTVNEDKFSIPYSVYMPYSGYDTLHFLRNGKDTIVLIGNGKKEYIEEVFRGDGDCLVKYRLLHQTLDFYSQAHNLKFTAHYFKYSETTAFRDFYEAKMNDVPIIKPVPAFLTSDGTKTTMFVLGVEHRAVFPISNTSNDSIYIAFPPNPRTKVVRIKHQNDIYEVLP
jgi:hypothetical protein